MLIFRPTFAIFQKSLSVIDPNMIKIVNSQDYDMKRFLSYLN
jgi:hypothetical protein